MRITVTVHAGCSRTRRCFALQTVSGVSVILNVCMVQKPQACLVCGMHPKRKENEGFDTTEQVVWRHKAGPNWTIS